MKRTLPLTSLLMLFASIFALTATSGMAQTDERSQVLSPTEINSPESTTCQTTVTAGNGVNRISLCISAHGNIFKFESPAGSEHFTPSGSIGGDGYVLCSSLGVHGHDAGSAESGFNTATTITQPGGPNTLPLTIVRQTTDSRFELTQLFELDTAEKDVTVTMTLRNISASTITGIQLARYFDANLDGTFGGDTFDKSQDSVWGRQTRALSLTGLTQTIARSTAVETFTNWSSTKSTCTPTAATVPTASGDFTGRLTYNLGSIPHDGTKTVKVVYRRS